MATNKFFPNFVKKILPFAPVVGVVSTCLLVASAVAQVADPILAAGWFGYSRLSVEVVDKPTPAENKRTLRTRVEEIEVIDYPVVIQTHGVIQAHNQVTLTAEIAGVITKVSPSAYFSSTQPHKPAASGC